MSWRKKRPTVKDRFAAVIDRLFPERQIHLRTEGRVSYVRFGQRVQVALAAMMAAAVAWTVFSTVTYFRHDTIVAEKERQVAQSQHAYRSLLGEVADYQKKFNNLASDLEDSHVLMLNLVQKNATLQQNLSSVAKQLDVTREERERVATARERLKGKLTEIENKMRSMSTQNFSLTDNLNSVESDLRTALSERNQALFEGTGMRRRINELETRLNELQDAQDVSVQRLTDSTATYIDSMEKVIELAGLDVEKLLSKFDYAPTGQGGPFIAAGPDDLPAQQLKSNLLNLDGQLSRWETLQALMAYIPLAPPLNSFYVTSGFGKRRDPINKRWAAHYGLDLGSPFKSTVYATAPGVVTFAGWKGKYGKLVEITHRAGLKTRYGHLHKFFVKKGQKVKFHTKIGLLGSTGRSTGAHLHYEVVFNGRAKNPMKFIRAGRYVFQE